MAKRCLYIVAHHPVSPNYRGGGSAIYYEHLASLQSLGVEVDLWHYANPDTRRVYDAFVVEDRATYERVRAMCRTVNETVFPEKVGVRDLLRARTGDLLSGHRVDNPLYRSVACRELMRLMHTLQPDFIWAQHSGPCQLSVLQSEVPAVHAHHDWLYKVRGFSTGRPESMEQRQREERVAGSAAAVVSGSASECDQLRAIGCRHVSYIPVAYDDVVPFNPGARSPVPRLVHLGGLSTTANRVGLERFFEVVWPVLRERCPDLWVVGDLSGGSPELLEHLRQAKCTGFVRDLAAVLRPFDVHLIAWEHDTGTRTKLPLAFRHGQAVVAVRASVAGFPELADGHNCRLVDTLTEMSVVIKELLSSPAERERLGRAARATFEASFSREVLLPRYQKVVEAVSAAA
jgi:glycosyltransferase involved in cell wall biosynthesis